MNCSHLSSPQESQSLFCCLYRSWCHNPVTTVSLCFLTQNYRHAYDLIQKLYPSRALFCQLLRGRQGPEAPFLPRWWPSCHAPSLSLHSASGPQGIRTHKGTVWGVPERVLLTAEDRVMWGLWRGAAWRNRMSWGSGLGRPSPRVLVVPCRGRCSGEETGYTLLAADGATGGWCWGGAEGLGAREAGRPQREDVGEAPRACSPGSAGLLVRSSETFQGRHALPVTWWGEAA